MNEQSGPGYASPEAAQAQAPEKFIYVACLYEGTGIQEPDFIAVVDVDPESDQIPYLNGSPRVIQFGLRLSF